MDVVLLDGVFGSPLVYRNSKSSEEFAKMPNQRR